MLRWKFNLPNLLLIIDNQIVTGQHPTIRLSQSHQHCGIIAHQNPAHAKVERCPDSYPLIENL